VCEMSAISRRFERDLIPYALETDCPLEVPVICERVSSFGLLIPGNRDFFVNRGAEQVIRPDSQNEAQGKLPEINGLHDLPVF
jgi:hypothetical protein